jgi:hypothetical protein
MYYSRRRGRSERGFSFEPAGREPAPLLKGSILPETFPSSFLFFFSSSFFEMH